MSDCPHARQAVDTFRSAMTVRRVQCLDCGAVLSETCGAVSPASNTVCDQPPHGRWVQHEGAHPVSGYRHSW